MSLTFEAQTLHIAAGRNWVAARARDNGVAAERVAVLKLLASEVITNAVVHGPPHGQVTVRVLAVDGHLRVEVDDEGTRPPLLRDPTAAEIGGRGILLVETYATRWGCELRVDGGKTVWFELAL